MPKNGVAICKVEISRISSSMARHRTHKVYEEFWRNKLPWSHETVKTSTQQNRKEARRIQVFYTLISDLNLGMLILTQNTDSQA
jgi:hypothetical protein